MDRLRALLDAYLDRGDEDAMEEFVRRTRSRLLATLRRSVAGADVEDAVQAAYLALLRRGRAPWRGSILAWLKTTVVRLAYRRRAKAQREEEIARRLGRERSARPCGGVDAELVHNEVARLPARYRDPIALHYLHGLSTAETARLLGLPHATLRTRLFRGRALLRSRLGPRLAYLALALPWLCADAAHAAGLLAGGFVMSRKVAAVLVVVALLSGWAVMRSTSRGPARARTASAPAAVPADRAPAAPEPPPPEREPPFVTGIVTAPNGRPLPGVAVAERGPPAREEWVEPAAVVPLTHTDPAGRFELTRGAGALLFVKEEYAPKRVDVARGDDLRVVLQPARTIVGVVRDRAGRPIEAAFVSARAGAGPHLRTYTDAAGRYRLDTVPNRGPLGLSANAVGYEPVQAADTGPARQDFELTRFGLLVDVADVATGGLVPDAGAIVAQPGVDGLVVPANLSWMPPMFRAVPGRFFLAVYPESPRAKGVEADLHVFAPGYRPHVARLVWRSDEEPPHLRVALERGAGAPVLAGRVTGGPEARLELRLAFNPEHEPRWHDERLNLAAVGRTGSDGRFAFAGLPEGRYRLLASADGCGPVSLAVTVPRRDVTVALHPAATLELRALDAAGRPAPRAWFHVETGDRRRFWKVEADGLGIAVAEGLTPGPLVVFPLRGGDWLVPAEYAFAKTELTLDPGERRKLDVTVPTRVASSVDVRDPHGNARPGVKVLLSPEGGYVRFHGHRWLLDELDAVTDAEGRAAFRLFPGRYGVSARADGMRVRSRFDVEAAGTAGVVFPAVDVVRRVEGRVIDAVSGAPLRDVRVYAAGEDGHLVASARTGPGGRYVLSVELEQVRVRVQGRGYAHAWRDAVAPCAGVDFRIPPFAGPKPVRFEARVLDRADAEALREIFVDVEGFLDGAWISLTSLHTDERGMCGIDLPRVERYRVVAGRNGMYREAARDTQPVEDRIAIIFELERR